MTEENCLYAISRLYDSLNWDSLWFMLDCSEDGKTMYIHDYEDNGVDLTVSIKKDSESNGFILYLNEKRKKVEEFLCYSSYILTTYIRDFIEDLLLERVALD